jgi:ribosomal protein S27AE
MPRCPVCKDKNSMAPYMGLQFGKWVCKKCGYVGVIVLEEGDKSWK